MSDQQPSTNGSQTARGAGGRFSRGNPGGPGNPFAADVGRYRARLFKAIKAKDIDLAITTIREVMSKGKDADRLTAAKLLLDRAIGPAVEVDLIERISQLERAQQARQV